MRQISHEQQHLGPNFSYLDNHLSRMESSNPLSSRGNEVEVDVIPGTEIMKGANNVHVVHAYGSAESVVLIPQPTNSLDDPLVIAIL